VLSTGIAGMELLTLQAISNLRVVSKGFHQQNEAVFEGIVGKLSEL
jgi:hypothetical protein